MAYYESWAVGVMFRATSNIATVMAQSARSTGVMNAALTRQNAMIASQQRLLRAQASIYATTAVAIGAASAYGISQAAQWQQAITSVGIAMDTVAGKHGTFENALSPFYRMAVKMSNITAQSVTTIAQEMGVAATSGLANAHQLMTAFPLIAKAADVMWMAGKGTGRPIDPVAAVKQMFQVAHLFGEYSGPGFNSMINRIAQIMMSQPENLQSIVTQSKYFVPYARMAGISQEDIFRSMLTMGQTGLLKNRGGSGLRSVIQYLSGAATLTGHLSEAQHAALYKLGLTTSIGGHLNLEFLRSHTTLAGPKGGILLQKVVDHLEHIREEFSGPQLIALLNNAFLQRGGTVLAAMLQPNIYKQAKANWEHIEHMRTVSQMWVRYSNTAAYAWSDFMTNLQNMLGATFLPLLPKLTSGLKSAAQWLGNLTNFLMYHPKQAAMAAYGALTVMAISALAAARAVWRLNASLATLSHMKFGPGGGLLVTGGGAAGAAERELPLWRRVLLGGWGLIDGFFLGIPGLIVGALRSSWRTIGSVFGEIMRSLGSVISRSGFGLPRLILTKLWSWLDVGNAAQGLLKYAASFKTGFKMLLDPIASFIGKTIAIRSLGSALDVLGGSLLRLASIAAKFDPITAIPSFVLGTTGSLGSGAMSWEGALNAVGSNRWMRNWLDRHPTVQDPLAAVNAAYAKYLGIATQHDSGKHVTVNVHPGAITIHADADGPTMQKLGKALMDGLFNSAESDDRTHSILFPVTYSGSALSGQTS